MSPSEKKVKLMIYKSQIERELAQLVTMCYEHQDVVSPLDGNAFFLDDEYTKALNQARKISENLRLAILENIRQIE